MATDDPTEHDIADLTELWSVAAQAYLDGDLPRYASLANHAPDFTLTPPYGGDPAKASTGRTRRSRGQRRHSVAAT